MNKLVLVVLFLFLAACNESTNYPSTSPVPANPTITLMPMAWIIGPIIDGQNASHGVPVNPTAETGGGWSFVFPAVDGVHYVYTGASIANKTKIRMTYEIVADSSVKFLPTQGDPPARVRVYFQRKDDNWVRQDGRWWSPPTDLAPGQFTVEFPLTSDRWTGVMGQSDQATFESAKQASGAVGFTFGGMFAGHGAFATGGSAKFILRDFKVE